ARDSRMVSDAGYGGVAQERSGAGGDVHIKYVGEAAALFRLRGSGTIQQPGGELDAAGGVGTQELAARRQRAGRSQSGRDSFCGGILQASGRAHQEIPCRDIAGIEQSNPVGDRSANSGPLVRIASLTLFRQTDTIDMTEKVGEHFRW